MTRISSSRPPATHTAPSSTKPTKPENTGKPNKTDDPDEPNNNKKKKNDGSEDTSSSAAANEQQQSAIAEAIRAQEEQMLMQIYQRNKPKQLDIPKSKDEGEDEDDDVPTLKLS